MSRVIVSRCAALCAVLLVLSAIFTNRQIRGKENWSKYGLYYLDPRTALVISPDGRPIEPKANDPEAPTLPGFDVGSRHFKFVASQFSERGFSFRTERIDGTEYSFVGRLERNQST